MGQFTSGVIYVSPKTPPFAVGPVLSRQHQALPILSKKNNRQTMSGFETRRWI
jgi:hypothetical protein